MNNETHTIGHNVGQLAEDARALLNATADVAGEKASEARRRLTAALERGKEIYGTARDKAIEGSKVADQTIRENPYQTIAIGIGLGALVGYLIGRRCTGSRD